MDSYLIMSVVIKLMKIEETQIEGVKIISPSVYKDNRGSLFETFKSTLFELNGLPSNFFKIIR